MVKYLWQVADGLDIRLPRSLIESLLTTQRTGADELLVCAKETVSAVYVPAILLEIAVLAEKCG